jgi:hypothetical protein
MFVITFGYGSCRFDFCNSNLWRNWRFGVDDVVFVQKKEEIVILWFRKNRCRIKNYGSTWNG